MEIFRGTLPPQRSEEAQGRKMSSARRDHDFQRSHLPDDPGRRSPRKFGLVTAALSFLHALFALLPVLIIGGAAWLTVLSTFNVSVQVTAPVWIVLAQPTI